jgi:hypothetical protein
MPEKRIQNHGLGSLEDLLFIRYYEQRSYFPAFPSFTSKLYRQVQHLFQCIRGDAAGRGQIFEKFFPCFHAVAGTPEPVCLVLNIFGPCSGQKVPVSYLVQPKITYL